MGDWDKLAKAIIDQAVEDFDSNPDSFWLDIELFCNGEWITMLADNLDGEALFNLLVRRARNKGKKIPASDELEARNGCIKNYISLTHRIYSLVRQRKSKRDPELKSATAAAKKIYKDAIPEDREVMDYMNSPYFA